MKFRDLPYDMEFEILSRVPANSLMKFKTTCKRWHSLFKNPKFAEANSELVGAKETVSLLCMSFGVYTISINLHDRSMDISRRLRDRKYPKDMKVSQILHCNGLILCPTVGRARLFVWNPCTGETIRIKPRNRYKRFDTYALGYGGSNSAYKILRFGREEEDGSVVEFEIYDFSSGSWRVLEDFTSKWMISSNGVSLNGDTYWDAMDIEANFLHTFLRFDFTTERFVSTPLLYQRYFEDDETVALSVVRGERIALWQQQNDDTGFQTDVTIWLTNKIGEGSKEVSWSKFIAIDLRQFPLPRIDCNVTFVVDDENKVAVCCSDDHENGSYVYIVGEDSHKYVYRERVKNAYQTSSYLLSYVPSLVPIQAKLKKRG